MKQFFLLLVFSGACLLGYSKEKTSAKLNTEPMENTMKIEIWSDVMCPFCYIGKRKFEQAMAQFPHKDKVQVVWKSFQLSPDMQTDTGKNIHEFLAAHKG